MIVVHVTVEDIAIGEPRKCSRCPVALAIRRVSSRSWEVSGYAARCGADEIRMPRAVALFIKDFDDGRPVQPFSFEISPPEAF